jgi:hypothetical protein
LRCKGRRAWQEGCGPEIDGNSFTNFRMCATVFSLGDAPGPSGASQEEERRHRDF